MMSALGAALFDAELLRLRKMRGMDRVRVPTIQGGGWSAESGAAGTALIVDLPIDVLGRNLQEDVPAAPSFLICIAWWLQEHGERGRRTCLVRVRGTGSREGEVHRRRSLFLLSEYVRLLAPFFALELPEGSGWAWP